MADEGKNTNETLKKRGRARIFMNTWKKRKESKYTNEYMEEERDWRVRLLMNTCKKRKESKNID